MISWIFFVIVSGINVKGFLSLSLILENCNIRDTVLSMRQPCCQGLGWGGGTEKAPGGYS